MSDLFANAAEWRAQQSRKFASRPFTYERPGVKHTCEPPLMRGKSDHIIEGSDGVIETIHSYDFLATPADIALGPEPTEPREGDLITEQTDTERIVYEVLSPGGQPAWRWSNSFRTKLRIHTKILRREPITS